MRQPRRLSIVRRWVVTVVGLLVALAALVALTSVVGARSSGPASRAVLPAAVPHSVAVERTLAAGSARIDATYQPARGPTVSITGRISLVGPESEVSAAVGDEPAADVRVTADGAWLRPPGSGSWSAVSADQVAGTADTRGWGDVLRRLDPSSDVRTDAAGRIEWFRVARDRRGGTLEARLSDFGTEVNAVPP